MPQVAVKLGHHFIVYFRQVAVIFIGYFCPVHQVRYNALQVFNAISAGFHRVIAQVFILRMRIIRVQFCTKK